MIHARSDYNRIQDPAGLIAEDEPVFLIRGKDMVGPAAIRIWAELAELAGATDDIIDAAIQHANLMMKWQNDNGRKIPDLPEGL